MNKKINILEVVGTMNMGGAETFLMNALRNIDRNKFQLFFLTYGEEKYDYEDEINALGGIIIRISKPKKIFDFNQIKQIKNVIKNYKINIVHTHTYYNSIYSIMAAKINKNVKIITHSHTTKPKSTSNILKKTYYKISKYIINKYSDVLLACGKEAGESLFYTNNSFIIVDNGIIPEKFKFSQYKRKSIREKLNIEKNTLSIFHIGRFDKQKNQEYLIRIFNELQYYNNNSKLFLVGEGELKQQMINMVQELNLEEKVIFLGKRNDVNELFSAMDVFVFPSLVEGLPVSLIEAQTNGISIIASSNIDREVNYTKTIKFLSPVKENIKKWVLLINKTDENRYIDNYKKIKKSNYNIKVSIKKLEKIYLDLINN